MPVAKIHVLQGRYDEARLDRVSNAVHHGVDQRPGDTAGRLLSFIAGRPKAKRLALLKALNDGVVAAARIAPDDLVMTLYETPGENISFGRGLAQRADIADKEKVAT
jgi:hypothetical protein